MIDTSISHAGRKSTKIAELNFWPPDGEPRGLDLHFLHFLSRDKIYNFSELPTTPKESSQLAIVRRLSRAPTCNMQGENRFSRPGVVGCIK